MEQPFDDLAPKRKPSVALRVALILGAGIILLAPGLVFFGQRGGMSVLNGLSLPDFSRTIFPLFGLYAFTLVWFQIMIGSNMSRLRDIFPAIERYHRREGVFVFLFAWLHPTLLLIGVGGSAYLKHSYIAPNLVPYTYLGLLQLLLINLTVITALLRKTKFFQKYWRKIHILNYLTFFSIWTHSWFLGSDVQRTGLKYLWIFFMLTVATSAIARYRRGVN